jgi:hypothetical protein
MIPFRSDVAPQRGRGLKLRRNKMQLSVKAEHEPTIWVHDVEDLPKMEMKELPIDDPKCRRFMIGNVMIFFMAKSDD